MNASSVWKWALGAVAALAAVLLLWWAWGQGPASGASPTSTSTPVAATSTQGGVASEARSATVAAVAASVGSSQFASLFSSTGVGASLTGKGPYTVFVPDSAAYAASATIINAMSAAQKKRLVQYHVVAGKQLDIDAVSAGDYVALSKDSLNFNVRMQDKSAFVNSSYVVRQYKASNGIVYVIGGGVLIPPQAASSATGSTGSPVPR